MRKIVIANLITLLIVAIIGGLGLAAVKFKRHLEIQEAIEQHNIRLDKQRQKRQEVLKNKQAIKDINSEVFVDRAISITKQYSLSILPMTCIIFVAPEEIIGGKLVYVTVREKHNEECGGDPDTAPKLYSVGFDLNTNDVWTDARSEDAMMKLLENIEG